MRYGEIIQERRQSDQFLLGVADKVLDVAADRIAHLERPPHNPSEIPEVSIYGDVFSEDEAEDMSGKYRAFGLSGHSVRFTEPSKAEGLGFQVGGQYGGHSNAGNVEVVATKKDFYDLGAEWQKTWRGFSPRRIADVRSWLARFRRILVHELRHAFDSTASEDRYRDNKRSAVADRLRVAAIGQSANDPRTMAANRAYQRSPHEVSARFSHALAVMHGRPAIYSKDWELWRKAFLAAFGGYEQLSPRQQRQLLKRMYPEWQAMRPTS